MRHPIGGTRRGWQLAGAALAFCALTAGPAAAQAVRCSAFLYNADGTWTSFIEGTLLGSYGPVLVHPGERFKLGASKSQDDVARILNAMCLD